MLSRLCPRGKPPSTHFIGGWVDPRTSLDVKEWRKISTPLTPRIEPVPSKPIAKHLAYWATWPTIWNHIQFIYLNANWIHIYICIYISFPCGLLGLKSVLSWDSLFYLYPNFLKVLNIIEHEKIYNNALRNCINISSYTSHSNFLNDNASYSQIKRIK